SARAPPVTEGNRDDAYGLPGQDERRDLELPAVDGDGEHVAVAHAERLRIAYADQGGVVPCQLAQRIGTFLEPAVVGEATVVDARVGAEADFDTAGCGDLRRRERFDRRGDRFELTPRDQTIVQRDVERLVVAAEIASD